jgi:hypothetical protein
MNKILITLATATLGLATVIFPQVAQAGVSITLSSDYHPVIPQVYYPAPQVIYPAPQVVYPSYPSPRDYYRAQRRRHYNRAYFGQTVDYRYHDQRRDNYYDGGYDRRNDHFNRDNHRDSYDRH